LNKTTFLQKAFLLALGLFLAMLILEVSMRCGGFILTSLQEQRNRVSISRKETYRIMCLGESTTFNQYPLFLEEILNQRNIGIKFSVIDKGVSGTNTGAILSNLESSQYISSGYGYYYDGD